jgi:hypothetical protein
MKLDWDHGSATVMQHATIIPQALQGCGAPPIPRTTVPEIRVS